MNRLSLLPVCVVLLLALLTFGLACSLGDPDVEVTVSASELIGKTNFPQEGEVKVTIRTPAINHQVKGVLNKKYEFMATIPCATKQHGKLKHSFVLEHGGKELIGGSFSTDKDHCAPHCSVFVYFVIHNGKIGIMSMTKCKQKKTAEAQKEP